MCDLEIYLRKASEDKSRDYSDVQSLNLTASAGSCCGVDMSVDQAHGRSGMSKN